MEGCGVGGGGIIVSVPKTIVVHVDEKTHALLKTAAKRHGMTMGELVRSMCKRLEKQPPLKRLETVPSPPRDSEVISRPPFWKKGESDG